MTPQEALNLLNNVEFAEKYQGKDEYTDMLLMCKSALEKQIPKKVNNLEVFSDIGACIPKTKSGNCPVCNNFMIGNHTYCNDCGQALDWGDSE